MECDHLQHECLFTMATQSRNRQQQISVLGESRLQMVQAWRLTAVALASRSMKVLLFAASSAMAILPLFLMYSATALISSVEM